MLQICKKLGEFSKVLYVSGEESTHQLKLRAQRLRVESENLYVLSETCLGNVTECVREEKPDVLIVDSIQTLYNEEMDSPAGGVGQVKDCTMALMQLAKGQGITVFVIGHVNKEGSIAGPKVLEHMVDCVLYFEGDQHMTYRILRAAKNRFGATNEIGVFEMMDWGLKEVENPSEMLLSGRPKDAPGTCVTCAMEGARPVLAEVQALIAPASAANPRRMSNGFDYNRFAMLLAVLEKRGGLKVSACDAYLNIIGGLSLDEPAADLAAVIALASSYLDRPVPADLVAIGEVGLKDFSREVDALLEAPVVNVLGLLGDKLQGVDVGGGAGHLHHVVEEVLGAVLDAVLLLQRGSAQVDETTVESGRAAANAGCLKDDDFGTGLARLDGGCRAGASKTYHDDVGLFVPCHRIGSNARAGEIVFRARRGAGRKSAHGSYACSCKHRPFKK